MGDMGMTRDQFWSLTIREFWIKYAAFTRAEDRQRALIFELTLMTAPLGKKDKKQRFELKNAILSLRRYALKRWTIDGSENNGSGD